MNFYDAGLECPYKCTLMTIDHKKGGLAELLICD